MVAMHRFLFEDSLPGISGPIISVTVQSGETFSVYEGLIRSSSQFFDAALSYDWAEAQQRGVELPKRTSFNFQVYLQWLLTKRLHTCIRTPTLQKQAEWDALIAAYLLGDYLQDTRYKDTVMDALVQWAAETSVRRAAKPCMSSAEVYENTLESSPLRRLLVDLTVEREGPDFWKRSTDYTFPAAFLHSIIVGLAELAFGESPVKGGRLPITPTRGGYRCLYHCHGRELCYKM